MSWHRHQKNVIKGPKSWQVCWIFHISPFILTLPPTVLPESELWGPSELGSLAIQFLIGVGQHEALVGDRREKEREVTPLGHDCQSSCSSKTTTPSGWIPPRVTASSWEAICSPGHFTSTGRSSSLLHYFLLVSHSPNPISRPLTTFPSVTCSECVLSHDGDCSHEGKRCLLLGRKAIINLDGVLKSRGVTLLTKAHIVKALVFLVVMYGCERWAIKKAEHWRIDAFKLWCWRRLWQSLEQQGDQTSQS